MRSTYGDVLDVHGLLLSHRFYFNYIMPLSALIDSNENKLKGKNENELTQKCVKIFSAASNCFIGLNLIRCF